jgi:hypothetical protein
MKSFFCATVLLRWNKGKGTALATTMTPRELKKFIIPDIIPDHEDPESSDDIDSEEVLDAEVEKAELEAIEELAETKARYDESTRRNFIIEEAYNCEVYEYMELAKQDAKWPTLYAMVIAEYPDCLTHYQIEMVTLQRFSDEVHKDLKEMQAH